MTCPTNECRLFFLSSLDGDNSHRHQRLISYSARNRLVSNVDTTHDTRNLRFQSLPSHRVKSIEQWSENSIRMKMVSKPIRRSKPMENCRGSSIDVNLDWEQRQRSTPFCKDKSTENVHTFDIIDLISSSFFETSQFKRVPTFLEHLSFQGESVLSMLSDLQSNTKYSSNQIQWMWSSHVDLDQSLEYSTSLFNHQRTRGIRHFVRFVSLLCFSLRHLRLSSSSKELFPRRMPSNDLRDLSFHLRVSGRWNRNLRQSHFTFGLLSWSRNTLRRRQRTFLNDLRILSRSRLIHRCSTTLSMFGFLVERCGWNLHWPGERTRRFGTLVR